MSIFTIKLSDSNGHSEKEILTTDNSNNSLKLIDRQYLSVCWNSDDSEKYYDDEAEKKQVVNHESIEKEKLENLNQKIKQNQLKIKQ